MFNYSDKLNTLMETVKRIYEENWGKYPPSHDFLHVKRVLVIAEKIAREEGFTEEDILILKTAVILHDIAIAVTGSKNNHAEKSSKIAEDMLRKLGYPSKAVEVICTAIAEHSWRVNRKPSSRISAILQDADRIDALGAIGLARLFSYSTILGRLFYNEEEPIPRSRQLNEDRYALDHVFTKLAKIPDRMNTASGRRIAENRLKLLLKILGYMEREIEGKM
ncbi:MAG TPA: HD domain-containing protein [Thermoprotei archaeon]|nr:HD domain-containing protein [Thermoprotei archaeon]